MRSRIMYIENKTDGLSGPAWIGRVSFSKTGRTVYYGNLALQKTGSGYKWNHFDVETLDRYWVSGPRRDGVDRLYGERLPVPIDEDVRVEYWTSIRRRPDLVHRTDARI